jgi:hypothetical protein
MDDVDHGSPRQRRVAGLVGFIGAAALPVVLWHRAIAVLASDFRLELDYLLTGWLGYGLIAGGLLLLLPVALSAGRRPGTRLYPRWRNAWMGWGVSLYLMGCVVAAQVATIL